MTRVAIAGLGSIGAGYADVGTTPRNHVSAALAAGCQIVALADPDGQARERVAHIAAVVPTLTSVAEGSADVVAICGPTQARAQQFSEALALGPRVLIVEKPLALNASDAQRLLDVAKRQEVEVRVNYLRRFDARHEALRAIWPGVPRTVTTRYAGGMHNYASHTLDQLLDWFGPVTAVRALVAHEQTESGTDPSLSFICHFAAGFAASFAGVEALDYALLESELVFDDRVVALGCGGAESRVFVPRDGHIYAGFRHLAEDREQYQSAPVGGLLETYLACKRYVETGEELRGCTGTQALRLAGVLEAVSASARTDGKLEMLQ